MKTTEFTCDDSIAVKIMTLKSAVVMDIMMRQCWESFNWDINTNTRLSE